MLSPEGVFGTSSFSVLEGGFSPWEGDEFLSFLQQPENTVNSNSGSDEPNPSGSAPDERKLRRMISNRESARRSRMRKQRHLEDLRNQVNKLKIHNRELSNQLSSVSHHSHLIRRDNDRLRSESMALRQKLSLIRQLLIYQQLQQLSSPSPFNTIAPISEQIPSLIA